MIKKYLRTGPNDLTVAVDRLPLGASRNEGIDHRVVDWAMGDLPEPAAREVEARLHSFLQEAAEVGRVMARRQCVLWLTASVTVLVALFLYYSLRPAT